MRVLAVFSVGTTSSAGALLLAPGQAFYNTNAEQCGASHWALVTSSEPKMTSAGLRSKAGGTPRCAGPSNCAHPTLLGSHMARSKLCSTSAWLREEGHTVHCPGPWRKRMRQRRRQRGQDHGSGSTAARHIACDMRPGSIPHPGKSGTGPSFMGIIIVGADSLCHFDMRQHRSLKLGVVAQQAPARARTSCSNTLRPGAGSWNRSFRPDRHLAGLIALQTGSRSMVAALCSEMHVSLHGRSEKCPSWKLNGALESAGLAMCIHKPLSLANNIGGPRLGEQHIAGIPMQAGEHEDAPTPVWQAEAYSTHMMWINN